MFIFSNKKLAVPKSIKMFNYFTFQQLLNYEKATINFSILKK